MMFRLPSILGWTAIVAAGAGTWGAVVSGASVTVELFSTPGCGDCAHVRNVVLPEVVRRYGEKIRIQEFDIDILTNYTRLATYQERFAADASVTVSVIVQGRAYLGGVTAVATGLWDRIDEQLSIADRVDVPASPGDPAVIERRYRSFTLGMVIVGGMVDSFNPCAFATIIFFVSLLAASGIRDRRLLIVGAGYNGAVFLTYLLIGTGAFHILHMLAAFRTATTLLQWFMLFFLLLFAWLSFRDAYRYRATGSAAAVTLQLPDRFKKKIHAIMRSRLAPGHLLAGSVMIGVLVTLIESVCTGQVYLPVLVHLARQPGHGFRVWGLLLIYNLFFILPLIIITGIAYFGVTSHRLIEMSRRNVIWGKILLGIFFLLMAAVMIWL